MELGLELKQGLAFSHYAEKGIHSTGTREASARPLNFSKSQAYGTGPQF